MKNCVPKATRHEYDPVEMTVLYKIHEASYRTALPIVISVLKHISASEEETISEDNLVNKVKEDDLLKSVGCCVKDDTIVKHIITNLSDQKFVEITEAGLKLTKCGKKAAAILKLKPEDLTLENKE